MVAIYKYTSERWMSSRDDNDNSNKLTADYTMNLQFSFCFLQIRQQRMMIYLALGAEDLYFLQFILFITASLLLRTTPPLPAGERKLKKRFFILHRLEEKQTLNVDW